MEKTANDKFTQENLRSEFTREVEFFAGGKQCDISIMGDFDIEFTTPYTTTPYVCKARHTYLGEYGEYENCYIQDGEFHVVLDAHTLKQGQIKATAIVHVLDTHFPDRYMSRPKETLLPVVMVAGNPENLDKIQLWSLQVDEEAYEIAKDTTEEMQPTRNLNGDEPYVPNPNTRKLLVPEKWGTYKTQLIDYHCGIKSVEMRNKGGEWRSTDIFQSYRGGNKDVELHLAGKCEGNSQGRYGNAVTIVCEECDPNEGNDYWYNYGDDGWIFLHGEFKISFDVAGYIGSRETAVHFLRQLPKLSAKNKCYVRLRDALTDELTEDDMNIALSKGWSLWFVPLEYSVFDKYQGTEINPPTA